MKDEKRNRSETEKQIRETFLHMLEETPFDKIRITGLCREAGINRSTFYAHFYDIYDLLDKTIENALTCLDGSLPKDYSFSIGHLWELANIGDLDEFISHESEFPIWHRFVDFPKFIPLLKDPFISQRTVRLIFQKRKDLFVELLHGGSLSDKELEMLFWFILNGSMSINQKTGWEKNRTWYKLQKEMMRFIIAGCETVKNGTKIPLPEGK